MKEYEDIDEYLSIINYENQQIKPKIKLNLSSLIKNNEQPDLLYSNEIQQISQKCLCFQTISQKPSRNIKIQSSNFNTNKLLITAKQSGELQNLDLCNESRQFQYVRNYNIYAFSTNNNNFQISQVIVTFYDLNDAKKFANQLNKNSKIEYCYLMTLNDYDFIDYFLVIQYCNKVLPLFINVYSKFGLVYDLIELDNQNAIFFFSNTKSIKKLEKNQKTLLENKENLNENQTQQEICIVINQTKILTFETCIDIYIQYADQNKIQFLEQKQIFDYHISSNPHLSFVQSTIMIRNIPNRYNQQTFLNLINQKFQGQFDFLYIPIDFKNKCNIGYAFINIMNLHHVQRFIQEFHNKKWDYSKSEKVCQLDFARIQGRFNLIKHFQNSNIFNITDDKSMQPLILPNPQADLLIF